VPADLKVGIHALGFVGDTDAQAEEDFFPGYAEAFTKIGKERGWPATTRAQFNAVVGPKGALIVAGPEKVAEKIRYYDEVLGGIARMDLQMSVAGLAQDKLIHATELLGTTVSPLLRQQSV